MSYPSGGTRRQWSLLLIRGFRVVHRCVCAPPPLPNMKVVTDTRLWLRSKLAEATQDLSTLMQVSCEAAETHMDVLMAG